LFFQFDYSFIDTKKLIDIGHEAAYGNDPSAKEVHRAAEKCTTPLFSATKQSSEKIHAV